MSKPVEKTKILEDGLRYKSKAGGSPFSSASSLGATTMSCFLCGKHRPRNEMMFRKFIGKSQTICDPKCN